MCGRYVSATPPDQLARFFGAASLMGMPGNPDERYVGNYNVAPTQGVFTVYESSGERLLDRFHWGLVPFWAKDPSVGSKMINARAETLAEKNSFKRPFATKRCIIPADGFYEWKKVEGHKRKQPMFLTTIDDSPFAFAGLWEVWSNERELDAAGEPLQLFSCTIVTCEANDTIAAVHDRMPVMLPPAAWDTWLDRDNRDLEALRELLVPAPSEFIRMHPVSTEVNNVRNNGAHLVAEAEPVTGS